MACGALEPLLPNLQISEGSNISLKISRPIQTQIHQYYLNLNFADNFQYRYIFKQLGMATNNIIYKYIYIYQINVKR